MKQSLRVLLLVCGPKPDDITASHGTFADYLHRAVEPYWKNAVAAAATIRCAAAGASAINLLPTISYMTVNVFDDDMPESDRAPDQPRTEMPLSRLFRDPAVTSVPFDAIILSGSKYNVTEGRPFVGKVQAWIAEKCVAQKPTPPWVFGICFGHQLLADHFAGRGAVVVNSKGPELGSHECRLTAAAEGDPLWRVARLTTRGSVEDIGQTTDSASSSSSTFLANELHYETVARVKPSDAGAGDEKGLAAASSVVVLANSAADHHQCVRWRPHIYSVQFHPEYSATFMRDTVPFLHMNDKAEEARVMASIQPTPLSESLVASFLALCAFSR